MRIASGTAGGLLSALVSAVTAIPGMSTTMAVVSMIIVSLIARAWISTILYSLFRKFFDADRERDYDNDKFEISIIGGTEHEEYEELREKVKNNTADEDETKRYQELHKKLEDAKKDQVSKDKAKEKKEKDEQKAKEQAEKNKGQTAQGNQAKNYMYGQYGVPTYKGSYNGYGMYGVPAGRGDTTATAYAGNSMIGNMMNSVTSSISGLFTSQNRVRIS